MCVRSIHYVPQQRQCIVPHRWQLFSVSSQASNVSTTHESEKLRQKWRLIKMHLAVSHVLNSPLYNV
jgi:hypothetical protein